MPGDETVRVWRQRRPIRRHGGRAGLEESTAAGNRADEDTAGLGGGGRGLFEDGRKRRRMEVVVGGRAMALPLYVTSSENPRAEDEIESIEVLSAMTARTPVLIATSAE
jgi:hypothetical protein